MNPSSFRSVFRVVARAEALTWAGLLIGMFFKWVVQDDPHASPEGGVPILGALHGGVFVVYLVTTLIAWWVFRWRPRVAVIALLAAIPPLTTLAFERSADRRGLLVRSTAPVPAG